MLSRCVQLFNMLPIKVPSEVESKVFWSRYFFAVQIAEMDEELRQSFALKELTVKTAADAKKNKSGITLYSTLH